MSCIGSARVGSLECGPRWPRFAASRRAGQAGVPFGGRRLMEAGPPHDPDRHHDKPHLARRPDALLERIATAGARGAPCPAGLRSGRGGCLPLGAGAAAGAGAAGGPCRHGAAHRHRPGAGDPGREHRALRPGPAGQQRPPLGRARHGQVLPGEGGARRHQRPPPGGRAADEARGDPPGGHRGPARPDGPAPARSAPLAGLLRRPVVRCRRHLLQVPEDRARRRHRGPPANVLFYATSNRRLLARDMVENERSTAINPGEAVEEKVPSPTGSASGSASTSAARTSTSR